MNKTSERVIPFPFISNFHAIFLLFFSVCAVYIEIYPLDYFRNTHQLRLKINITLASASASASAVASAAEQILGWIYVWDLSDFFALPQPPSPSFSSLHKWNVQNQQSHLFLLTCGDCHASTSASASPLTLCDHWRTTWNEGKWKIKCVCVCLVAFASASSLPLSSPPSITAAHIMMLGFCVRKLCENQLKKSVLRQLETFSFPYSFRLCCVIQAW